MKETDFNFLSKLKNGKVPCSKIPESVKNKTYFKNLVSDKVIIPDENSNWARGNIIVNPKYQTDFEKFFNNNFKDVSGYEINKASNIKGLRDSKSRKTASQGLYFIRGNTNIILDGITVDLGKACEEYGQLAPLGKTLKCEKICYIENLFMYLNAEKIFSNDYVFLHSYGRLGEAILNNIDVEEVLVVSDYDFVGLNEYLKIKEKINNSTFYIPTNFDQLFDQYSRPLKNIRQNTKQLPSNRVINSDDDQVVRIREKIFATQKFLEQEILIPIAQREE